MNWKEFEELARKKMSTHFGVELREGCLVGSPKKFDMLSVAEGIVGDAKYLSLVRGEGLPPAKFMEIAGHVWLLERVWSCPRRFLVFGNQQSVPEWWLRKYGRLVDTVDFYFLSDDGKLNQLNANRASLKVTRMGL